MKIETLMKKIEAAGVTVTREDEEGVTTLTAAPDYEWDWPVEFFVYPTHTMTHHATKKFASVAAAIRWAAILQHVTGTARPFGTKKTRGCEARTRRAGGK